MKAKIHALLSESQKSLRKEKGRIFFFFLTEKRTNKT